jgi:hypothetical protein
MQCVIRPGEMGKPSPTPPRVGQFAFSLRLSPSTVGCNHFSMAYVFVSARSSHLTAKYAVSIRGAITGCQGRVLFVPAKKNRFFLWTSTPAGWGDRTRVCPAGGERYGAGRALRTGRHSFPHFSRPVLSYWVLMLLWVVDADTTHRRITEPILIDDRLHVVGIRNASDENLDAGLART